VRKQTYKLDAAGNTTAAIGKCFAIGSACLVSLSLFGAYLTRVEADSETANYPVNVLDYHLQWTDYRCYDHLRFQSLTMSAVGQAAMEIIDEIKNNFKIKRQAMLLTLTEVWQSTLTIPSR